MTTDPREILSANVSALIERSGLSMSAWAREHGLKPKRVHRALTQEHSTTLDVVESIAAAAGLQAWQLLMPGLDPANPPVFTITQSERDLYARLRDQILQLPITGPEKSEPKGSGGGGAWGDGGISGSRLTR
jgi:hypothetical protein